MVEYWKNSSNWRSIPMSHAQALVNDGNFVVAGWINPVPGESGHVVAVVPGEEVYSKSWGGMVPVVMDTGKNKRFTSTSIANSFGSNKKPDVLFFIYEP